MQNKTALFILLFFAGITLLFFMLNRQMETEKNRQLREQLEMEKSFNGMNEELNNQLAYTTVSDVIIVDTLLQEYSLSTLVSKKPVLVFRYSGLNCGTCYGAEIISLQNIFSPEDRQIAILSSYNDKRHFISDRKDARIEFPFYLIPQDAFDWILEEYGTPYYFVLHPDLTVSHIFIPDIVLKDLNKQYLERIKCYLSDYSKNEKN